MIDCRWEDPETSDPCLSPASWRVEGVPSCDEHAGWIAQTVRMRYGVRTICLEWIVRDAEPDAEGPLYDWEPADAGPRELTAWDLLRVVR
jgi:hypothetical protein